uniref:DOF zinc finger protein DOF3.2 n=1 Tax=Tanacetum cinerariifolium TaxID=118510 RepID=A0A6L2LHI5_TANCI|nr:DOF zinc finger protein DOF3.2 [Tanacetum cinerariifolium]
MVALRYKDEHNKVGYLLKPTESDDYHQIIDFLSASHIRTPELGPPAILATIEKTPYTITEELVRSRLQLADDRGIADLPIPEIYSRMDNLGYVTEGKLTFFKNKFSPQWRPQTSDPITSVLKHDHSSDLHESAVGSFPTMEDAPLRGDFHTSPLRSSHAPSAGQPLGAKLHDHKRLFKDVVGKLVKKVKTLEVKLKTKKRKMVVSDSDQEGSNTQDVDLDALRALANAAVVVDSDIPSGSTSHISAASPCAHTVVPSSTSVVLAATLAVPSDVPVATSAVPSGTFIVPAATSAIPSGTSTVPAAALVVPVGSPNVPASVSSKGKSPMVEEDIPVKARTFKQMEEDRLGEEAAKRLHDEEMAQMERERAKA